MATVARAYRRPMVTAMAMPTAMISTTTHTAAGVSAKTLTAAVAVRFAATATTATTVRTFRPRLIPATTTKGG